MMTNELDDFDGAILEGLQQVWNAADPPPADLDARVMFALDLERLDFEVAGLRAETLVGSGARTTERTRTVTFDCESLTVMVSILPGDSGVRVDGWLAPPAPLRVELRTAPADPDAQSVSRFSVADEAGRFVFTDVPRGLAQLRVSVAGGGGRTVVTPSIVL
jgi:hypothetical protein